MWSRRMTAAVLQLESRDWRPVYRADFWVSLNHRRDPGGFAIRRRDPKSASAFIGSVTHSSSSRHVEHIGGWAYVLSLIVVDT